MIAKRPEAGVGHREVLPQAGYNEIFELGQSVGQAPYYPLRGSK